MAIGLGGNLADPLRWFRIAARVLASLVDELVAAPLYRTEAVSTLPQPDYLNTVLVGVTTVPAADLLAVAKALELAAGRRLGPRHAARPLDVDLLVYDEVVAEGAELRLPHPELRARRFALQPLADLDPDLALPPDGLTVREVLAALPEGQAVERLGPWLPQRRLSMRR